MTRRQAQIARRSLAKALTIATKARLPAARRRVRELLKAGPVVAERFFARVEHLPNDNLPRCLYCLAPAPPARHPRNGRCAAR